MKNHLLSLLTLCLLTAACNASSGDGVGTGAPDASAPANLSADPISSTQIDLGWDASTDNVGVVSYSVHRCAGVGCTPVTVIATIAHTAYTDTGLSPSTTYTYAVSARDAADNQSDRSATASATTPASPADTTPPTVPTGLTATPASATQINLSWSPSTDNVGVTKYTVYRCTGASCAPTVEIGTVVSGTSFQDTGLTDNTTFRYAISASDQADNDSALSSPPVSATTPTSSDATAPSAATGLIATVQSSSRIDLAWQASTDNVGVTQYKVYRCTGASCTPNQVVGTPTGTSFSDTGLTANTTYRHAVTASDAAGNESGPSAPQTATTQPTVNAQTFTLIGAGDIATSASAAEPTARLLDAAVAADPNTTVFTTGDHAYHNGSASDFANKYNPSWGRHKARTRPSPGSHDYVTSGASGYLNYFCPSSTDCSFPGGTRQLYYSYKLGDWHIISLDSEAATAANSAQLTWLGNDLAAHHTNSCVLAYWHQPRFTSGSTHSDSAEVQPFWDALYAAKADVVVVGHNHHYERFAKQNPSQAADPAGIRQFVVGTGGAGNYGFSTPKPLSEVRFTHSTIQGVIKFTLRNGSYDWSFLKTDGTVGDSGTNNACNKK